MAETNVPPKMFDFTEDEAAYAETVCRIVAPVVESLARTFSPKTEVVLHDLTRVPNSIVAIAQSMTGRSVGGPPTDLGMLTIASGRAEDLIGYRTHTEDGKVLRSSSVFFRTPLGKAVACLCINADIDELLRIQDFVQGLTHTEDPHWHNQPGPEPRETFATSVEELAEGILRDALIGAGVRVEKMKKSHKLEVVRELDRRGFFALKESVDMAARSLGVTRYTIYNYINEAKPDS